ncbi:hypothetical protein [Bifidobacterium oedipodis]|uniref:Two-component sensor protein n=1 Tax=Bifidobacterium oedipodis TaxID=2675322 RepID=A0A7Y0EPU7_9BIFI|nr:hypothetical protein [Bifidobacterium sp. DSM 109957]NMM94227.1 Two-component sensor protein [Bifidobacterium sp. DSM 109957]
MKSTLIARMGESMRKIIATALRLLRMRWMLTALTVAAGACSLAVALVDVTLAMNLVYHPLLGALMSAYVVALVMLPFQPVWAAGALIVVCAGWVASVPYEVGTFAGGVCLAVGVLAYRGAECAFWLPFIGWGLFLVGTGIGWVWHRHDIYRLGDMLLPIALAATAAFFLGWSLHWRVLANEGQTARMERQRAEFELARRRQNEHVAKRVHDSLTGSLSYIVLMAQRQIATDPTSADDATVWRNIERNALEALSGVRKVIGLLEAGDTPDMAEANGLRSFETITREQDAKLADLGIDGTSVVIDPGVDIADDTRLRAAYAILEEIYANLMRHCPVGVNAYFLRVGVSEEGITIAEANAMREHGEQASSLPDSGTGLVRHALELRRVGGTLDYRAENGEWLLSAFIPNADISSRH